MINVPAAIEQFIFPQFCSLCQSALDQNEQLFCPSCLENKLLIANLGDCVTELKTASHLDFALPLYWFDDVLQSYIHHLKYSGWIKFLFKLINTSQINFLKSNFRTDTVLTPVPLHPLKERERGFNQSYFIALAFSRSLKLPLYKGLIKRNRYTESQTKLSITQRRKNMYLAFEAIGDVPKSVLLVDDVLTTGATADACASALKDKGSEWVGVITLALPKTENKFR